jgi:hypothetical protein
VLNSRNKINIKGQGYPTSGSTPTSSIKVQCRPISICKYRNLSISSYSLLCYYRIQTLEMRGQRDAYTFLRFTAKNCSCIPSGRTIREVAKRFMVTIAKHTKVDMIWVAGRSPTLVSQNLKATTLTYLAIKGQYIAWYNSINRLKT